MAKYQVAVVGRFADAFKGPVDGWIGVNNGIIGGVYEGRPAASEADSFLEYDDGCLILPGFVDPHVHCREPGNEHKEDWRTLGLAAAHGGVTTVATMPNYGRGNSIVSRERLERVKKLSEKCIVDRRFWVGVSPDNVGKLDEMRDPLVVGYKLFTTPFDSDLAFPSDNYATFIDKLDTAVHKVGQTNLPLAVHCEDESLFDAKAKTSEEPWAYSLWRTPEAEYKMAERVVAMAARSGTRLHICHASTPQTVEAANKYWRADYEVTWHHMCLSTNDMIGRTHFRMNPPLRSPADREVLDQLVTSGVAYMIGTDHAPHTFEEKMSEKCPAGVPALDTYGSLLRHRISCKTMNPRTAAMLTSFAPAHHLLNLKDRGRIRQGYRADFAVLKLADGARPMRIYSKCGWSPFQTGDFVEATIIGGKEVFRKGEPVGL